MGKNFDTNDLPLGVILGSAFGCGAGVAILWLWPLGPLAKKRVESGQVVLAAGISRKKDSPAGKDTDTDLASGHPVKPEEEFEDNPAEGDDKHVSGEEVNKVKADTKNAEEQGEANTADTKPKFTSSLRKLSQSFADHTFNQDLEGQSMAENAKAKQIWENAELYDENAEMLFTYLQVFTASMNSFAHGGKSQGIRIGFDLTHR